MRILGHLLDECGRAIGAQDSALFTRATEDLAKRLVGSGFGVVDGEIGARVTATIKVLRTLLTSAAMPGADAKTKARVDSVALACANVDARATQFGRYPPIPGEGDGSTETGRRRRASRRAAKVENGRTGKDAASGAPDA